MPELPDIVVYLDALAQRVQGRVLQKVRLANPFLLRSVEPPIMPGVVFVTTGALRLPASCACALAAPIESAKAATSASAHGCFERVLFTSSLPSRRAEARRSDRCESNDRFLNLQGGFVTAQGENRGRSGVAGAPRG